jgi:hypothetical protein
MKKPMFGTRADLAVDFTWCVTLLAPWVAFTSFRLAHRRSQRSQWVHRKIQLWLLAICVAAVLILETRIRLAGGSLAFLGQSRLGHTHSARVLLAVHICFAVATYAAWGWLATASMRRHGEALPGAFSRRHRQLGWLVFGGLCFTSVSATAVYWLTFIA